MWGVSCSQVLLAEVSYLALSIFWASLVSVHGAVLCFAWCLAASLASTHQMPVKTSPPGLGELKTSPDCSYVSSWHILR